MRLALNGVPIPGYDNFYKMPAPQADGLSSELELDTTLVIQPGAPQALTVQVTIFAGGNANYGSAWVHGWTWTDAQDKQWRTGVGIPQ